MKTINFGGKEFNDKNLYMIGDRVYNCALGITESGGLRFFNRHTGQGGIVPEENADEVFLVKTGRVPNAKVKPESGKLYQFGSDDSFSRGRIGIFAYTMTGKFIDEEGNGWQLCRPVPEELRVFGE